MLFCRAPLVLLLGALALLATSRATLQREDFANCYSSSALDIVKPYADDIHGKCMVVLGGDSGLGFAAARALATSGASVIIASHKAAKGERAAARIDALLSLVKVVPLDLNSFDSVRAAASDMERLCGGKVDALLANAGISWDRGYADVTPDGFDHIFQVDFLGQALLIELLLPSLRKAQGRVIHTTGDSNFLPCLADAAPRKPDGTYDLASTVWNMENYTACITLQGFAKAATAQAPLSFVRPIHASGERLIDTPTRIGVFRYGLAKFAQTLHAFEFAKREEVNGVHAFSVDPALVITEIWTCKDDKKVEELTKDNLEKVAVSKSDHGFVPPKLENPAKFNRTCGGAYDLGLSDEEYEKVLAHAVERVAKLYGVKPEGMVLADQGAATLAWLAAAPIEGRLAEANGRHFRHCQPVDSVRDVLVQNGGEAEASSFVSRLYDLNRAFVLGGPPWVDRSY